MRPRDKIGLIASERWRALQSFMWSSHRAYAGLAKAPAWLCVEWLSFFGKRSAEARRRYLDFVRAGFDEVLEAPWSRLRGGLVLGSEDLWERVKGLVKGKAGADELLWVRREHRSGPAAAGVSALLRETRDERMKVWIRVRLGGERKADVARSLGYRDGSGVLQVLKRLEAQAARESSLLEQLEQFRSAFLSSVQS